MIFNLMIINTSGGGDDPPIPPEPVDKVITYPSEGAWESQTAGSGALLRMELHQQYDPLTNKSTIKLKFKAKCDGAWSELSGTKYAYGTVKDGNNVIHTFNTNNDYFIYNGTNWVNLKNGQTGNDLEITFQKTHNVNGSLSFQMTIYMNVFTGYQDQYFGFSETFTVNLNSNLTLNSFTPDEAEMEYDDI